MDVISKDGTRPSGNGGKRLNGNLSVYGLLGTILGIELHKVRIAAASKFEPGV